MEVVGKLFTDLGPRYKARPGGYLSILTLGPRPGDSAPMAIVLLTERGEVRTTAGEG
jgi:large subunit ribosomal protein L17